MASVLPWCAGDVLCAAVVQSKSGAMRTFEVVFTISGLGGAFTGPYDFTLSGITITEQ